MRIMEKTPEYALEAGIAVWTADNQDIVKCALELSTETTNLGLVDTNRLLWALYLRKFLVLMAI